MIKKSLLTLCGIGFLSLATSALSSCSFRGTGSSDYDQELPEDDPSSEVVIDFWHCLGHDKTSNLTKIVQQFNKDYDGLYEVKLTKVAGDYDSLHDSVKTKLAAGEVPALCMGYPDSFAEYISDDINQSAILRLDNFINDEEFGYTPAELDDFIDEYLEEGQNYQFEGTWSMPMYKSTEIAYYNGGYFAGDNTQNIRYMARTYQTSEPTTYNEFETLRRAASSKNATDEQLDALYEFTKAHNGYYYDVSVTWDEMVALGRDIVADRNTESVTGSFIPIGYDSDANLYISQFAQRGIPFTVNNEDTNDNPSAHYAFVNDEAKAFVKEVTDLIKEGVFMTKGSLGEKYTNEYFTAGQAAFVVGSTGGSSYNVSSNFKVKLASVPYYGETRKYIMQGPSICLFNNNDPYIHKGAWLFYKTLASTENNTALALENSYDPVLESCYETDRYKQWVDRAGQDLKYDITAATLPLHDYYMTSPVFVGSSVAREEIGKITANVVNSGTSIDQAFVEAYNRCTR